MTKQYIVAEIVLFSEKEGGRHCMPTGSGYSPHFLLEGSSEYLGVRFIDVPKDVKPNFAFNLIVELLYPDTVNYEGLTRDISFEIREGPKTIGTGKVVKEPYVDNSAT